MKYQTATLLLAGLATAAPVAQAPSLPPFSNDAARAGGILSGLADGFKGSQIPGAEGLASILNGLGGGLANPQVTRGGVVDVNSLVQSIQKRQNQPARPPPTTADMERASSIVSGLANGLKSSNIPGSAGIASILEGLGGGIGKGAAPTTAKRQSRPERPDRPRPERPERPPPTAADMERASSILKGLSDGLNKAFPGSASVASILSGLSGGVKEGAKNPPAAAPVTAPTAAPAKAAGGMEGMAGMTKRQGAVLPPPGTPEARKSAGEILQGLAKGISSSAIPLNNGVAGILNSVGGGLEAAAALPPAPGAVSASAPA